MVDGSAFLGAMDRKAKWLAPGARATVASNQALGSWLLDPLARWAFAAYGERVFDDAARGYAKYCLGVAKAQQVYEQAGKYTPEALPDVISEVYEDECYMVPYMWAAILIYPFWPSMIHHLALYRNEFLKALPPQANVVEIASGHGVLGLMAAEERSDIRVEGIDISPPAVAVANRILQASGHADRVTFKVKNALDIEQEGSRGQYQGIIAAMLAEHLEDPRPLFRAISHLLADDGVVFFSTAIESAQRDHVYEFNQESEPLKMAEDVGLRVTRLVSDASAAPPVGARFLPRATAMILRRR
ncbi:MAG: class I SAM-dependent methyltransferase [Candidatus Korobacteraceae bacterium]|jgi:2-polyprenyl-3-methyl-5-hydroxy-6-metoxy-1,4-benzoquinol methylase